jgi:hypothetical protein
MLIGLEPWEVRALAELGGTLSPSSELLQLVPAY